MISKINNQIIYNFYNCVLLGLIYLIDLLYYIILIFLNKIYQVSFYYFVETIRYIWVVVLIIKLRIIEYMKIKCLEKKTKLIQQMKGTMERWSDCLGEFSLASIRRWRFLFQSSKQLFSISVHSLPQDSRIHISSRLGDAWAFSSCCVHWRPLLEDWSKATQILHHSTNHIPSEFLHIRAIWIRTELGVF